MRINRVAVGIAIASLVAGAAGLPVARADSPNKPQSVVVTNDAATPVPLGWTVPVGNLPATQPVSGIVTVGNLPATQTISGTVAISGIPTVAVQDKQPFHTDVALSLSSGFSAMINIPNGK